jgi:hypothetical protein
MIRREDYHHTPEQVAGYLDTALAMANGAEIPDEWRLPVLLKAVDLLASKQIFYEQPGALPRVMIPDHKRR